MQEMIKLEATHMKKWEKHTKAAAASKSDVQRDLHKTAATAQMRAANAADAVARRIWSREHYDEIAAASTEASNAANKS